MSTALTAGTSAPSTWRHELAGCLHSCTATLFEARGLVPSWVLGAGWRFHYVPGDVRREEYYFPCPPGESLVAALVPYHPIRSTWHHPASADEGWVQVREAVQRGPVAVAVDNFHLPFRPAFYDVHSNHLISVHAIDTERDVALVHDMTPPRFTGELPVEVLQRSRGSVNEGAHERDMFFADQPIAQRWFDVEIDHDRLPAHDAAWVDEVRARNHAHYWDNAASAYDGRGGLAASLDRAASRSGPEAADELFVLAGATLASTAVHASWLHLVAERLHRPDLLLPARLVDRLAHHWTAVRILAAQGRVRQVPAARLRSRFDALLADYDRCHAQPENTGWF